MRRSRRSSSSVSRWSSPPPAERIEAANRALDRAQKVGEEYDTVEVNASVVKARDVGAGIVQTARDRGVEVIVIGGEPPTRIRGGAILGGIGGTRPDEIGPVTEYVLRKAPCRVLLTAPPEDVARDGAPAREPAAVRSDAPVPD